jgi:hypothetical protein
LQADDGCLGSTLNYGDSDDDDDDYFVINKVVM